MAGKRENGSKESVLFVFSKDPRFGVFLIVSVMGLHLLNSFFAKNNILAVPLGLAMNLLIPGFSWLPVLSRRQTGFGEKILLAIVLSISLVIFSVSISSLVLKIPLNGTTIPLILSAATLSGLVSRKIFLKESVR